MKEKTVYCKRCGERLNENNKCTNCGKQYFKFRLSNFLFVFSTILFILAISVEAKYIFSYQNDISNAKIEITNLKNSLEEEKTESSEIISYLRKNLNENNDELDFYRQNAVIVSNNGTKKYHNYGCEDLMLNSFWIYNTEAAESQGYTMCKKCYDKKHVSSLNWDALKK